MSKLHTALALASLLTPGLMVHAASPAAAADLSGERIGFNRHIRPILSANCFACHGFDANARKADLRLDAPGIALDPQRDPPAIVPGRSSESELIRRIFSSDPEEIMPPPETHHVLTPAQRHLLRDWIDQGAEYEPHWAFLPPKRPADPPRTPWDDRAANPIDRYVFARLAREGLEPSPPAAPALRIRRLFLDLIGLPPSPAQVDAFTRDPSRAAWDKSVDLLLASPHFGERLAIPWLDLARYADTVGYHGDQPVSVFPYRDYVIASFNQNKPFDRFTRENLAGDLFPNPALEQRIASGFNRLNMTTEEGGSQPKEYLAKYASDRVRTTSTVWLGATIGCAECHDHKFDPYTSRDFYALAAFFADIEETGVYSNRGRPPEIAVPTHAGRTRLTELQAEETAIRKLHEEPSQEWAGPFEEWRAETSGAGGGRASAEDDGDRRELWRRFTLESPHFDASRRRLEAIAAERESIEEQSPKTLTTVSVSPRSIRILPRGNWLDESGPEVAPAIPSFLGTLDTGERRATRMDLADWILAPDNPLTARVFVNRLWKQYFGNGLSRVLDDLGSQGEWPTHPDLLDWLALEFQETGWDIKHVVGLIVRSQAYQQTSQAHQSLRERDPYNRLLARQSRFRLDAELVRDQALAASGLLVPEIGGRSVFPYQPEGYYQHLNFPKRSYTADAGAYQYRRGLYTHWQRTFLHPMLKAFDAPSRDECAANRPRSNTPLQALALLNDPTFVEASRALASRILTPAGPESGPRQRLDRAFRLTLSRSPSPQEEALMLKFLQESRSEFTQHPKRASEFLDIGQAATSFQGDSAELAAWTSLCRCLLNLHETVARY
ncbi:MAG TPA: DUF1553 domain-containing protein [Verrucomicrobiales bacterium]|nr:DUF1553 domain-containing protein [Verrucomicrobiales bacterium]